MESRPLDREQFPRTCKALESAVADGVAPGFVAGVYLASEPGIARVGATGQRRLIPSPQPMLPDTLFDLASVSKVVATATLAATLVDRGWIDWESPLEAFLPATRLKGVRLRHLLAHTAGLPAWQPLWQRLRDRFAPTPLYRVSVEERQAEMRRLVLEVEPEAPVDQKSVYSDPSFLLLGFALEEATGMPLDHAVPRFVWSAMGEGGLHYRRVERAPEASILDEAAATEKDEWRGVLQGQVHDENCWAMGGYGGHAGVFGRAEDVLRVAAALLGGFLSPATLRAAWTRVASPVGCERTLGWDTPSGPASSAGRYFSTRSVGHLGFTGTSLWIDPEAGIAATLLSNRVHPTRDNVKIRELRPRFHDALREDLAARGATRG